MAIEKGDLVLVDYIGKSDGEIFDLSLEEKAEEEGMKRQDQEYKPIPVLVGERYVIEGFEDTVSEMEVGEEKEIDVPSEKAYGPRSSDNVETYPEKEFKRQGVNVSRGETVMIGNRQGKVISASSGRIKVDFNHPLSGKDLHYWIRVNEKVEDDEDKAEYIYSYRVGHGDIEIGDGTVTIPRKHSHGDHEHELPQKVLDSVKEEIEEYTDLKVEFVDTLGE